MIFSINVLVSIKNTKQTVDPNLVFALNFKVFKNEKNGI